MVKKTSASLTHPRRPLNAFRPRLYPIAILLLATSIWQVEASDFDVRDYGATGDGTTLDSPSINRAIEAAAKAGGGTVRLPAGDYLSYSIRLKSDITIYLESGATLIAADPPPIGESFGYDAPEPNEHNLYQDFGHTHWKNSLIWGIDLENASILGPGLIFGRGLSQGLSRKGPYPQTLENKKASGDNKIQPDPSIVPGPFNYPGKTDTLPAGIGNKTIALKNCRNVTLRDFRILHGGHFGILATGVDNLTIDNLIIDTNRDGIDIDACNNVRVSNTSVNSPFDDAICLKASYALGYNRACENVTITNCYVSGFDEGTLLDGTRQRNHPWPTGRIKLGTEANGGFRNITISNCIFENARGLALEQVDGGVLEDIAITNITMRDIINAPIFVRLGERLRGPEGTEVGSVKRIHISNIVASNVSKRDGQFSPHSIFLVGTPGHPIEDLSIDNVIIEYAGGGSRADADLQVEEHADGYPEPGVWGKLPAWGVYARHVNDLSLSNIRLNANAPDLRHAIILDTVDQAKLNSIQLPSPAAGAAMPLSKRTVTNLSIHNSENLGTNTNP